MFVASMNPCPCGFYGSKEKECNCGSHGAPDMSAMGGGLY